jgi:acyl-CoA thioester hydrolase
MQPVHEIEIRVRYHETDAQGVVHHGTYFNYFELGRTEMLRAGGRDYQQLEADGLMLVVTEISARYIQPCRFGDVVTLCTEVASAKGVRIRHNYVVSRKGETIATGESTVACVDRSGAVRRLPEFLRRNDKA